MSHSNEQLIEICGTIEDIPLYSDPEIDELTRTFDPSTYVTSYSVRPKPGATVSTPLKWSEVTSKLHPSQFTIKNIPQRLEKQGDLFKGVLGKGVNMEKVLDKIAKLSS